MTNRKIGIVHWVGQLISYVCIFEIKKKLHDIFSRNTELIVNSMIWNMLNFTIQKKTEGEGKGFNQSKCIYGHLTMLFWSKPIHQQTTDNQRHSNLNA